jgi:hypothetical protein
MTRVLVLMCFRLQQLVYKLIDFDYGGWIDGRDQEFCL